MGRRWHGGPWRTPLISSFALLLAACGETERSAPGGAEGTGISGDAPEESPRPDIVLVLLDTLRPDQLSAYGNAEDLTPFLSRIAKRSAVFRRAFSASSWTAPSTASVFTGLYPTEHGVVRGFFANRRDQREEGEGEEDPEVKLNTLPEDLPTLPAVLHDAGYQTFGISSNINVGPEIGFHRGFDEFECQRQAPAAEIVRKVVEWKRKRDPARPAFFYVHLNDAHQPYTPRSPWYRPKDTPLADDLSRYRSEIAYLDQSLNSLVHQMGWDRTALFVVSDHGEEFGEHGRTGHGFSLHYELNHVLMMFDLPESGGAQVCDDRNVGLVDVFPTILDYAGLSPPGPCEGRSLLPLLQAGEEHAAERDALRAELEVRSLFAHRAQIDDALFAVILGRFKAIRSKSRDQLQLFDLEADPLESRDLSAENPDQAQFLGVMLDDFEKRKGPGSASAARALPLDPATLQHLRELGYVGDEDR